MSDAARTLLLTNDDGIDAPGLEALRTALAGQGRLSVVAPAWAYSGCGHRVTTHEPIVVTRHSADRIATTGTPADCVRVALHHLVADVSWVVSGINEGGNLGADVYTSGTVAAVREAVLHGRPGIAISHYQARGRTIDWSIAARRTRVVLGMLLERRWEPGTFWNVNLPHLEPAAPEPAVVFCPLDPSPLPVSYRLEGDKAHYSGVYHERARQPSSDVDVCFQGQIAVSLIRLG